VQRIIKWQQFPSSDVTPGTNATAAFASWLPLWISLKAAVIGHVISRSTKTTVLFAIVSSTKAAKPDKDIPACK